jgi:transposase
VSFREVPVHEVREVLRLWVSGKGYRAIGRMARLDRKTVRRYVEAGTDAGLRVEDGPGQLTDELIGAVCQAVRPARPEGHGAAWEALEPHEQLIKDWLDPNKQDLRLTKVHTLLTRRGVAVPYRTLHRFATERCGFGTRRETVRVDDGEPGVECQIDFGRMGLVPDPLAGRRRVTHALIFTACYSRHSFVHLTHRQTTEAVIEGCEAAWSFFSGVFRVVIPDNTSAIVDDADPVAPRFNEAFFEYAQSRGFLIDACRVGKSTDKPRVERSVSYVRESLFKGEDFADLADAQRVALRWCLETAGMRVHGTTCRRPLEVFEAEERPLLLPAPVFPYDLPLYRDPKVHRDRHVEVAKALYSVPARLVGSYVHARADSKVVKIFHRGELVRVHPRQQAGGRHTDPSDISPGKVIYATRDTARLVAEAGRFGDQVRTYASRLLDVELPWTRMRQVYRLLGLGRRYGETRLDDACRRALEADVVDVGVVSRMLERGASGAKEPRVVAQTLPLRYVREASEIGGRR